MGLSSVAGQATVVFFLPQTGKTPRTVRGETKNKGNVHVSPSATATDTHWPVPATEVFASTQHQLCAQFRKLAIACQAKKTKKTKFS